MKQADLSAAREMLRGLLDYSKCDTVRSIYQRIAPSEKDGRIRSWMNPAGTETTRFSHAESWLATSTNLGNLPKKVAKLDPLYDVRGCVVADEGRVLVAADYAAAEAMVAAWDAGDRLAMKQYAEGIDRYRFFAAHVRDGHADAMATVPKMLRNSVGKVGILALQYGVSWQTFLENVNADADLTGVAIDAKTAKRAVDLFHKLYPAYRRWWDRLESQVDVDGYITNVFGYRRDFYARTDSKAAREARKREIVATVPQSTIACLLNSRLTEVFESHDPKDVRLLLQVHDEILCDCEEGEEERVARLLRDVLEIDIEVGERPLRVPVEVKVGRAWATMEEV